jgi:ribosomal-protein-alanine N-acetyltransferase
MQVVHESSESNSLFLGKLRITPRVAKCSTQSVDLRSRHRWDGPLSKAQSAQAREEGVPLSYDPAQNGWVPSTATGVHDDVDPPIWACSPRCLLRPWGHKDLEQFHALLDDPTLWQYMVEEMPKPFTKSVAADLLAISNDGAHHEVRAISTSSGPVGQVRMLWCSPGLRPGEAEISYWLGRQFRGRGWATDAVKQTVMAAFHSHPGLCRVVAYVHPDNKGSAAVLKRVGFERFDVRPSDGWQGFSFGRLSV